MTEKNITGPFEYKRWWDGKVRDVGVLGFCSNHLILPIWMLNQAPLTDWQQRKKTFKVSGILGMKFINEVQVYWIEFIIFRFTIQWLLYSFIIFIINNIFFDYPLYTGILCSTVAALKGADGVTNCKSFNLNCRIF